MQELLKKLFSAYYRDVYLYLYSLCRDGNLAEDLAGETFLEAVRSIALFKGEADPKTWLFSIARHRWYHWLRTQKRHPAPEELSGAEVSGDPDLAAWAADRELAERIRELLQNEPPRTQGILKMRMEGYSFHEIGAKYAITESSARVIEFRAKNKIKEILKKEGFLDE